MKKKSKVSNEKSTETDGPQVPPMVKDSSITKKIANFLRKLFRIGRKKESMKKGLKSLPSSSTSSDGPQVPPMVKDSSITKKIANFLRKLFRIGRKKKEK